MSWLVKLVLDWALDKLTSWLGGLIRFFERKKQIEDQAKESKKPLDQAKTEKEIDDAAKDILGGM